MRPAPSRPYLADNEFEILQEVIARRFARGETRRRPGPRRRRRLPVAGDQ